MDVVLNHCSKGSQILEEHPEFTYNLENSPHLRVAYELDQALDSFSKDLANRRVPQYSSGSQIRSEQDLLVIIRILKNDVIPRLKLNEFFLAEVGAVIRHFKEAGIEPVNDEVRQLAQAKGLDKAVFHQLLIGEGEARFGIRFDSGRLKSLFQHQNMPESSWEGEIRRLVAKLNAAHQARFDADVTEILRNIEGDIRFHKLEKKDFTICGSNSLVKRYFTELHNGQAVAYNGFIMDNRKVLEDFAGKGARHYFKRSIVIWDDSVKLRYGSSRAECEELWIRMETYMSNMARAFKGIRLDNAHGTPLHVSSHLLEVARAANPNLLVVAELFTSDAKMDTLFVTRLGINGLIREAMNAWDTRQLSALVYSYGYGESHSLGCLEETDVTNDSLLSRVLGDSALRLAPTPLPGLFYDCTHDNETPSHKRTAADALPTSAIVAFTNTASATTRGFDELIPEQLSVVTEERLYKTEEHTIHLPRVVMAPSGDAGVAVTVYYEDTSRHCNSVDLKGNWDNWSQAIHLS